jgi:ribonuclease HI
MHFFKHRDLGQSFFYQKTHVKFAFECASQAEVPLNECDYPSMGLPVIQPPWQNHPAKIHFDFITPPITKPDNESTIHIFTDGSKFNGKTGYSMIAIGHHDTIKITRQRISNFASAFEAEALALNEALKLPGHLPETYSTVKIYTDSKSSLQSLINEQRTSSVLAENQILAHQLGSKINLHLQWVPGHQNIEGNEWADRIARLSTTVSDNCVRHTKISQSLFKSKIDKWLSKIWELEWLSATTNSTIRTFFPSLSSLKVLSDTPPRQITQIISGHCSLNAFLYKIKKTSSPRCRFCLTNDETIDHFLFCCPFFDQDRKNFRQNSLKITKSWPPIPSLIPQSAPLWKSFVNFIISSRRLSYSCVSQMS